MVEKTFLRANELLETSYRLGLAVYSSGFRPSVVIGIWRGGTPVAIAVHELLSYLGVKVDHYPIRTASYNGIAERATSVDVLGLEIITEKLTATDRVLVVDDVHDTGLTIEHTLRTLSDKCGERTPHAIRIATAYYKPKSNRTQREPDYFVHRTERWLVFPHELTGLTPRQILDNKPEAWVLRDVLESR